MKLPSEVEARTLEWMWEETYRALEAALQTEPPVSIRAVSYTHLDVYKRQLFFFMIVTTMREVTLKVQFQVPQGTELEKLAKKSLVSFIYIGKPLPEMCIRDRYGICERRQTLQS